MDKLCNIWGCKNKATKICRSCGQVLCVACSGQHSTSCPKDFPLIRDFKQSDSMFKHNKKR